jgi:hypothetical protein
MERRNQSPQGPHRQEALPGTRIVMLNPDHGVGESRRGAIRAYFFLLGCVEVERERSAIPLS